MAQKESLHLGQQVLYGEQKTEAVIDALTQTAAGIVVDGKYIICRYADIYTEE